MPEPDQTQVRCRFLLHGLVALVTLGLYMPAWLAWRDQEVRQRAEVTTGVPSGWALGAGAALAVIARAVLGGGSSGAAAGLSVVGIAVFLTGVYQAAATLAGVLERLELEVTAPPALVTGAMGVVFVGVEIGNLVASWWLRVPVIAALLLLPYAFWRLHLGFETVRARVPQPGEATS